MSSEEDLVTQVTGKWDYGSLPANVRIGEDVYIESKLMFARYFSEQDPGLVLADRVRIYAAGWGGGFGIEPSGCVEIGEDSIIVGAQFMSAGRIRLGKRVRISFNAIVTDSDFHPTDPDLRRRDSVVMSPCGYGAVRPEYPHGEVIIGDDVEIGIGAMILKNVVIGAGAVIRPAALVTSDVPPGAVVGGNPAAILPT